MLAFFAMAQAFVPLLGIEDDESLFAAPLFPPRAWHFAIKSGRLRIPLMVMSYIGTLKTALYAAIFRVWHASVWSAREPMVVAGAASVWLFYRLLRRTAGPRAAAIGAVLLATDACYLLTSVFDWGPVALQHLLLLGGMLLVVRFAQEKNERDLAGGFLLFGLAMWDKALAVWMLSGMAVAAAAVFWPTLRALATRRRAGKAMLWFLIGCSPLIVFNGKTHWSTFRGNVKRDTSDIPGKARMLMNTVNGQGLFGYLTDEDWQTPHPRGGANPLPDSRHTLMFYACILALLLAPFAPRTVAFCGIALAVAWIQMAVTANTGGSVHHTILLWPLPVWMVAVTIDAALRRFAVPLVCVLVAANLLVVNAYHVTMVRNGGSVSWSDAVFPLAQKLEAAQTPAVFCADWGIQDSLRLLGRGSIASYDLTGAPDNPAVFADPRYLFIGRTKDLEVFQGNAARLAAAGQAAGYRREEVAAISDSFGRPTYLVWRFVR